MCEKSEWAQAFSTLAVLVLAGTGCVEHRIVTAGNSIPATPGKSVVTTGSVPVAITNDPASTGGTDRPAKVSGREILVASRSPSAIENIVTDSPPPPQVEVVGAAPGAEFVWMPGIWTWQRSWVWISGRWVHRPNPEAKWVSGHWTEQSKGWVWVRGYWR